MVGFENFTYSSFHREEEIKVKREIRKATYYAKVEFAKEKLLWKNLHIEEDSETKLVWILVT